MRSLKTGVGARTVLVGHAFIQNIRRGHYERAADAPPKLRVTAPSMSSLKRIDPNQQATHGDCDQTMQQSPPDCLVAENEGPLRQRVAVDAPASERRRIVIV